MTDYYEKYEGDLFAGHIAKASDINMVQQHVQDAIREAVNDLTEGQSWILGKNDQSDKDSFILSPDTKRDGRYIDQMNLASDNDVEVLSIRQIDYRQSIKLTRSSIYSIIVKLQNKSERDIPVYFELWDKEEQLLPNMKAKITVPANTNTPAEFEVIFDLEHYPTAFGLESEDLELDENLIAMDNSDDEEKESSADNEEPEKIENSSAGASVLYLVVKALNKNKLQDFNINTTQDDGYAWNDDDPTFGIVINKNSTYGQLLEENSGSGYSPSTTPGDLYFKTVYANAPTYKCNYGEAIIGGQKVALTSTHVSVGGASEYGDVVSYIYMDVEGRLRFKNSDPYIGDDMAEPEDVDEDHLHIANIITYANDTQNPIIEQSDETQETRPRSHHERLRRLEKKIDYTQDIAIPPRIKYSLSGTSWIDENPNVDLTDKYYNKTEAKSIDSIGSNNYSVTTDVYGNTVIKTSKSKTLSIPVTLKSETSGKVSKEKDKTKILSGPQTSTYINELATDDVARAQTFAEIKNMRIDITNGTMTLDSTSDDSVTIATTAKEAKETEFNPWDDSKSNRPAKADVKPTTRSYTVNKDSNGSDSEYPAMTFYTKTEVKFKKLEIPIHKFKNCSGVKFIIFKRQNSNNKSNTVWIKKRIWTTPVFSLKNAKTKNGYQYQDDGFLINFGKKGLTLEKGQYIIMCLPIPKSGKGTVYVETYKPENPKDFCIRYYGAANASHFLLKKKYFEVWYNSAKAIGEEVTYSKKGSVVSGTVSWKNTETIKSVKPTANLTTPDGTTATIYVDVGGGWKEVKNKETTSLTGSGTGESFRFKIEFKGNKKATPTLKYNKKKDYAIKFDITRMPPDIANSGSQATIDGNQCLTSVVFDGNKILREYLGDINLATSDSKFSNFEFERIWTSDESNTMTIDIHGGDNRQQVYKTNSDGSTVPETVNGSYVYFPLYSLYYVDLTLNDFNTDSVDYSNYDASVEYDENNLRLKLDSENSYNDDNIGVINLKDFEVLSDNYKIESDSVDDEDKDNLNIKVSDIESSETNQILARARPTNPIDFTKYTGMKIRFRLKGGAAGDSLSGLGLYLSAQRETTVPSNLNSDDITTIKEAKLPDLNASTEENQAEYANQTVLFTTTKNGISYPAYYKSIWNSTTNEWEWQQVHDIKSFNIYKLTNKSKDNSNTFYYKDTVEEGQDEAPVNEYACEILIDSNDSKLQYVKEIGLISLNDENEAKVSNINYISIESFSAIKADYYNIFEGSNGNTFKKYNNKVTDTNLKITAKSDTTPVANAIKIKHQTIESEGEIICTFNEIEKSTEGFKHVGIQIASDCLLVKNMLKVQLNNVDKETGVRKTIDEINLPTINYLYYATEGSKHLNLSQVFKKLKTSDEFNEVAIVATPKFKEYMSKLKSGVDGSNNDYMTLYIGNIALYRAETIPMFHQFMRTKIYMDGVDEIKKDEIHIRKLGVIADYI